MMMMMQCLVYWCNCHLPVYKLIRDLLYLQLDRFSCLCCVKNASQIRYRYLTNNALFSGITIRENTTKSTQGYFNIFADNDFNVKYSTGQWRSIICNSWLTSILFVLKPNKCQHCSYFFRCFSAIEFQFNFLLNNLTIVNYAHIFTLHFFLTPRHTVCLEPPCGRLDCVLADILKRRNSDSISVMICLTSSSSTHHCCLFQVYSCRQIHYFEAFFYFDSSSS